MYDNVPCPNQGCKGGKTHSIVGFDIFWNDCPICGGSGSIKSHVPDVTNCQVKPHGGIPDVSAYDNAIRCTSPPHAEELYKIYRERKDLKKLKNASQLIERRKGGRAE